MGEPTIQPGVRVRVTQQTPRARGDAWRTTVEGTVEAYGQEKSGSWFAHAKDDKVWVDRIRVRKDDGEIVVMNLDQYSRVEVIDSE